MIPNIITPRFWLLCTVVAAGVGLISVRSNAQDTGYAVGENGPTDSTPDTVAVSNSSAGPVRMARFSYVKGNVTWRPDESTDWSAAPDNLPLKEGAQVWVASGSRAEVQFDDGSYLRLGGGAIATIKVLFSDAEGEFTQISLTNGLAMLRIKHGMSVYQLDTPVVSAKADGPARIRLGVSTGVEIGVLEGTVAIEGSQGNASLKRGDFVSLRDASSPYNVVALPGADTWENWNAERDTMLVSASVSLAGHHVPANIALVAGDLGAYGVWRTDPVYGEVWCPSVVDTSWRPYYAGHWVWVNPFGWTWCSDEPWGWAPYHYGTWFHAGYGWAWRPGPVRQYWSPAVVSFSESNGNIAWCALSPSEVHYPAAFGIGFARGNWSGFFSIGMAGCYYPAEGSYCVGRAFDTVTVNHATYVSGFNRERPGLGGSFTFAANNNTYLAGHAFIPVNSRNAAGAVQASETTFGGHGTFSTLPAGSSDVFARGRIIGMPSPGHAPLAGPSVVKPSTESLMPSRGFARPSSDSGSIGNRQVYGSAGFGTNRSPIGVGQTNTKPSTPASGNTGTFTRPGGSPTGGPPERGSDEAQRARAAVHSHDSGKTDGGSHGGGGKDSGSSHGGKDSGGHEDHKSP